MAGSSRGRSDAIEFAHYWGGGDGGAAMASLVDSFNRSAGGAALADTTYDNHRLQVKSRILTETSPEVWAGWPGGELRGYVEASTALDVTRVWEDNDFERHFRSFVADSVRLDGRYYAVPISVHRVNDLFVNTELVDATGVDPATASGPRELVEVLAQVEDDGVAGTLIPMTDPTDVLQLWETVLLGVADARTFDAVASGNAAAHRDAVRSALECVARLASFAPDDAVYHSMTDTNDQFVDGAALAYQQGDWAAGYFAETENFDYGSEWDRVSFPGTEDYYDIVLDAAIPSATADIEAVEPLLRHVASPAVQEEFNALKGSIPPREDASTDVFGEFGRDQARLLDESSEQPRTIAHGLSVTPAQLVDLKSAFVEFVDTWDADATTRRLVETFDRP